MKNRRMLKIGLSLMIALMFVIPTGAVLADDKKDADNFSDIIAPRNTDTEKQLIRPIATIDQAGNPVVEMDTTTDILGFYLETCVGDTIYPVPADAIIPKESCYEPMFKLQTLPGPSTYEPEIEIYKMNADQDFCLYQTSFEDNALNYLEWGQIDKDCYAEGGYYDGWAWSDARACGSDHSFKCTMYDEYKNMQDDVLYLKDCIDLTQDEFELCDGSILELKDGEVVGKVKVQFDIFVDGERNADDWDDYENESGSGHDGELNGTFVAPLDYLQFGFYDCSQGIPYDGDTINYDGYPGPSGGPNLFQNSSEPDPDNGLWGLIDNDKDGGPDSGIFWSTQIGLFDVEFNYDYRYLFDGETTYCTKIDGCPGWWHVEYETDEFPDEMGIFFEWRSDKERVFEGAYVDNVEIDITKDFGEKIYQGHSQNWLVQENSDTHWFTFPLDWDNDIEVSIDFDEDGVDQDPTYYLAICKIKADNGTYSDWKEIPFEIGSVAECIVEITGVEDDFSHEPIPDGGIMQYPSDAHIQYCYTNDGNVPSENVEITATGYKLVKETIFEDDFEGMLNWAYFYDEHPLYASDKFAFSGSKSLAFNQPENDMIVGGSVAGIPQTSVEYIGYSQQYIDMEDVDEAVLDFYWQAVLPEGASFYVCALGYHYIVLVDNVFNGPICQKTWIGPMQPQGMYESIDFDYIFWLLTVLDYMKDDNGHDTYETGIGFYLDTTYVNKEEFVPECCFEPGEVPWSGVYIDDVTVTATKKGDAVWTDSQVIAGPCDPGEKCCDQFTWEDVPYSNYLIEVAADCDDSVDDWEIMVLEDLEQASKIETVNYDECDPDAWCISDVVGNDCADDHYALATNCDTNEIPEGANDYIGLEYIDIQHIDLACGGDGGSAMFCQEMIDDVETNGHGAFSSDYYPYRVYDNYDLGSDATITDFTFYGLEAYGDDTFAGTTFNVGFYEDDGGTPGAEVLDQEWTCADTGTFIQTWLGYSIWLVEGTLDTPVSAPAQGWFSVQSQGYADLAWIDGVGDGNAEQWYAGSPYAILDYDLAFCISSEPLVKGIECQVVIDEGFEAGPTPTGWTNTGWLWDYYGAPCEGVHWDYSWAAGDTLTTPLITFGNASTTLTFQKAAESSTHPMDLELYIDGSTFIDGWYGYTHTDCQTVTVNLPADGLDHTISFVGMTSDFYGQILDDVVVEVCNEFPDPEPEGEPIWFNMTYQCDIRSDMGSVILEVAGYQETDGGFCDGCEDPFSCPAGVLAWDQIEEYTGNAPGVCQYTSVDLAEYLDCNDTHMCLRLRLNTDDPGPYNDIPGIGFHVHDLSISGILYNEILNETTDFVEDFEDANFVNEESGLVWVIDCVSYAAEWIECDEFKFCLADECAEVTPYEPSCDTWTLSGEDSWGDGWDSDFDYFIDAWVDVYVNGALVVDTFYVGASSDSTTFTALPGDEIVVQYSTANGIYESEHDWRIEDCDGFVWFEYMIGTQTLDVPTEISTMDGSYPAEPVDSALVWTTEIQDAYEAYLTANWEYDIGAGAVLDFELSADGGTNWYIIAHEEGPKSVMLSPVPGTPFDLTPWAGSALLIRVRLQNNGVDTNNDGVIDKWYDGYVCVDHLAIQGKQDLFPPTATISLSGNTVGPGLYAGPVTVTINAVDDMAMGEIHYILDGTESVVSGNKATFKVSDDGDHTVEFWAVDATGNEGGHSSVSFSIDNSPPTVAITGPETGLYLFGNKLLDMGKVFIIGAFTAQATADDAQGVAVVKFMLNGEVVGEDTEAPYDAYIAQKNMGAATLKVVAEDGVGNTASDSMDITYYKFL